MEFTPDMMATWIHDGQRSIFRTDELAPVGTVYSAIAIDSSAPARLTYFFSSIGECRTPILVWDHSAFYRDYQALGFPLPDKAA